MDDNQAEGRMSEDDRKMFVGGIAQEASEQDLRDYFEKYGQVESVILKLDPLTRRSRGFAFIIFASDDVLASVLEKDHVVKGKKVAVKKAASKQGKIYAGGFQEGVTDAEIRDLMAQYGSVIDIQRPVDRAKNEPKSFCFVTFEKEEVANDLIKKGTLTIKGKDIDIKRVNSKSNDPRFARGNQAWGGGYDPSWAFPGWGYDLSGAVWGYGGWTGGSWQGYGSGGGGGGRGRGGRQVPY